MEQELRLLLRSLLRVSYNVHTHSKANTHTRQRRYTTMGVCYGVSPPCASMPTSTTTSTTLSTSPRQHLFYVHFFVSATTSTPTPKPTRTPANAATRPLECAMGLVHHAPPLLLQRPRLLHSQRHHANTSSTFTSSCQPQRLHPLQSQHAHPPTPLHDHWSVLWG